MLRDDQRRARLVLADRRLGELGRPAVARPGPDAGRRRQARPARPPADPARPRAERRPPTPRARTRTNVCASREPLSKTRSKVPQRAGKPNSVRLRSALRRGVGWTTIPLGPPSLTDSSNLPGSDNRTGRPNGRAMRSPIWSCSVRGFACHACYQPRGALLPHLFTLTLRSTLSGVAQGGIFSVPLSVGLPRPGVTRRTALWSSDFPLPDGTSACAVTIRRRSSGSLRRIPSRRSPAKSCTAPASCRDYCAACR